MVEYKLNLDNIFSCLADPTRRDILRRLARKPQSVGQIARHYNLTYAGISKHLQVMEKARLVAKQRKGKQQVVELYPKALANADNFLKYYEHLWNQRLDGLERVLRQERQRILKSIS